MLTTINLIAVIFFTIIGLKFAKGKMSSDRYLELLITIIMVSVISNIIL